MATDAEADHGPDGLEGGSYELLRRRLSEAAKDLEDRAESLNRQRKQTFGGTELSVIGTEKVRTENNCVPRDMVAIGDVLLFAYNVFIGLKTETSIQDVFDLHRLEDGEDGPVLRALGIEGVPGLLDNPRFQKDFGELYRFYKGAQLVRVSIQRGRLLTMFQTGQTLDDLRGFRFGLSPTEGVSYIDNRAEEDYQLPSSHSFEWTKTTREDQVRGRHPHVNVLDTVFVETVGGDLTVKVEDNTEDGLGIFREPVDDPRQSLDDAEYWYARVGSLILLKILPYQEKTWRYLVFNPRNHDVKRVDALGLACLELPEDHGIIFPGGYYLQTGEMKIFDADIDDLVFDRSLSSPNGEDILYAFYHREHGRYLLLPYNLIRKDVQTPIACHGFTVFEDGRMLVFRGTSDEPSRVHPLQVWKTPFFSEEHALLRPSGGSYLEKVGNAELVRGLSEALSIGRLVRTENPSRQTFEDIVAACTRALDAYFWLDHEASGRLAEPIRKVREVTELVVDEFEKVLSLKERAKEALAEARFEQEDLLRDVRPSDWREIQSFLKGMSALRMQRGHLITLRDVRYIDIPALDALEQAVVEAFEAVSGACVRFLLGGEALDPLRADIERATDAGQKVKKALELEPIDEEAERLGEGLSLLSEVVAGLEVDDPTDRTRILEEISEVFAALNRCRATLDQRRKSLRSTEARSEFVAQVKLLAQSVQSAVALADTPEACDDQQSRLLVQLEDLEARFAELDEFMADLADKREEITVAFEAKRQHLLDERQRRAANLQKAAERILDGAERRSQTFTDEDTLNAYFASDPMVLKLRQLSDQLVALGDSVRADDIASRLKSAKQGALRNLRDKRDLFEEDGQLIKLGRHRFFVNDQPFDLSVLPRGEGMALHITGTDYWEAIEDEVFLSFRDYWDQSLVSETKEVYRGEYLAFMILDAAERGHHEWTIDDLFARARGDGSLLDAVRSFAANRHDEGYERGIHDADAAALLEKLLVLRTSAGVLRFGPAPRAAGLLYWVFGGDEESRARFHRRAQSLARLRATFAAGPAESDLARELSEEIRDFLEAKDLAAEGRGHVLAGQYLAEELAAEHPRFTESEASRRLVEDFLDRLRLEGHRQALDEDLRAFAEAPAEALGLAHAWLNAYLDTHSDAEALRRIVPEAAAFLVVGERVERQTSSALTDIRVEGLLGTHPRLTDGTLDLRIDEFSERLSTFRDQRVPAYRAFREARHRVLEAARVRLRLDELKPRVLTSFVRNKLIDQVYLPMIGDNLAKQLGAAGDDKRTDLMGMLLLVSPPGYGKTTLMEYVASRLGMAFLKVNGPALGHQVRSLDPSEAPNATAAQEVEKINLAFEMANNVMLYLDDIQHTHPELLQKFISLCDGQRRIEGVWKSRTRTYDLRGKKLCVVMAGNPYTESGDKFQIPDMLANRADTYNLGDILDGREEVFALSYLENALTSSPALGPMAARSLPDMHRFIARAKGREVPDTDFEQDWSAVEVEEAVGTLRSLFIAQDVLLKVNMQYIASASQDDRFRTEPPFKLQGSYRNMNKLAEKVVAAMNDDELDALITDHYVGEAQTLTSGAEANLLKLAELRGRLTETEALRWEEIRREFRRLQVVGGDDEDPAARIASVLGALAEHLDGIRRSVDQAATSSGSDGPHQQAILQSLARLHEALGHLSKPQLAVSVRNEPPAGLAEALAAPVAALEGALGPLARSATASQEQNRQLLPALTELVQLLRIQALSTPPHPTFPAAETPREP